MNYSRFLYEKYNKNIYWIILISDVDGKTLLLEVGKCVNFCDFRLYAKYVDSGIFRKYLKTYPRVLNIYE